MLAISIKNILYYYYHVPFLAHFMSSARGLNPENCSINISNKVQKRSFSNGQLSQPVVMQKYVSWGATWWMRWCRRGNITWCSCNHTTHVGSPKYVCDHLCIWKKIPLQMGSIEVVRPLGQISATLQNKTWP